MDLHAFKRKVVCCCYYYLLIEISFLGNIRPVKVTKFWFGEETFPR